MAAHRRPDRQEMFQAYVGMGDARSHQRVSEMFGISKTSVTAIAIKYEWMARLRMIARSAPSRWTPFGISAARPGASESK